MPKRENSMTATDRDEKGPVAVDKENPVSEAADFPDDREEGYEERQPAAGPVPAVEERRGFFDVYKSGQGFHTRIGTGMASAAIVGWFVYFLDQKLTTISNDPNTVKIWQVGISVAIIVAFGLFGYWLLALNRTVCDFLIQTESEMKKVSWTTRKDIIGSTKVVVFVMLALGVILFIADFAFMLFFNKINVLQGADMLQTLRQMF
jgi:preprotein translocase subunit SecE